MISPITKKELKRVRSLRKSIGRYEEGKLYFLGIDNKAYVCDQSGGAGTKEIFEWNKKLKAQLTAQSSLLE